MLEIAKVGEALWQNLASSPMRLGSPPMTMTINAVVAR